MVAHLVLAVAPVLRVKEMLAALEQAALLLAVVVVVLGVLVVLRIITTSLAEQVAQVLLQVLQVRPFITGLAAVVDRAHGVAQAD